MIDEFQVLLTRPGRGADGGGGLLEDLARRGRSQGIHLVLASQDVSGIEALWGRAGLVAQFTLRIALPKARRILAETNLAADTIPRFHAVVNADSGVPPANRWYALPDASDRATWRALQHSLWQRTAGRRRTSTPLRRRRRPAAARPLPAVARARRPRRSVRRRCSARRSTSRPGRRLLPLTARPAATWR